MPLQYIEWSVTIVWPHMNVFVAGGLPSSVGLSLPHCHLCAYVVYDANYFSEQIERIA